jgi:hypothetical protein
VEQELQYIDVVTQETQEMSQLKHCWAWRYFVLTQLVQEEEVAALQVTQFVLQSVHMLPTELGNA